MKVFFLFIISLFFVSLNGFSQSLITGTVVDQGDKLKLENATIMLLQAKDSILVDYVRTNAQGKFELKKPNKGEYLLIVSYPKYADYYQLVSSDNSTLGQIGLQSVAHLIEEIVITGRAAITIKGDTTEYDASQFKMEKNANVEDLLKVLPGISVDASGKITAQGKTVQKVLVDGEEFFGDDPTLVTRNLRSDMVDKVQVYEKKSEISERTGVDDGARVQTINVTLKEGAKNGVFGKALAGGGTDKYYMGQLMFNRFKGSQMISAYGLFGNNGTTTLNWQDAEKFAGDSGVSRSDEGGITLTSDPFSGQGVIGIPRSINSGVNYGDKWNEGKQKINLNYKYGQINSDGQDETIMSGLVNNNTTKNQKTENQQHRINVRYDLDVDSLNLFTIRANATKKKLWNNTTNNAQSFDVNNNLLNEVNGAEGSDDKINTYNFDFLYTHRFMKKGRSLTFNATATRDELTGEGFLISNRKYIPTAQDTTVDQRKEKNQKYTLYKGSLTYTEPITSTLNLLAGYSIETAKNASLIESYNKVGGQYTDLDQAFSSNYDFDRLSSNYRLGLNYNVEKFNATLTNNFNDDRLNQINNYTKSDLKRNFFTYNPRLNVGYNLSKNKRFNFNYSGTNNLPSLSQIQPILNNADPLNQYEGNENLNPSFTNSFNLFFVTFQVFSGNYTFVGANASTTSDPITQNIITDSKGINYYKWDNITGKTDFNTAGYAGTNFKLNKDLGLANEPQLSISYGLNNNFIDGKQNEIKSTNYNFTYKIMRETKTGFNFTMSFSPQYRQQTSNLSPNQNNSGFVFTSNGSLDYYINKSFKIYTNLDYSYEAPTEAFDQKIERFLITPGISKKFLKDETLTVDFMINDLLNDNIGYSRSQFNSIFTQRRYDTIQRYYMLKLTWDFNKMFTK